MVDLRRAQRFFGRITFHLGTLERHLGLGAAARTPETASSSSLTAWHACLARRPRSSRVAWAADALDTSASAVYARGGEATELGTSAFDGLELLGQGRLDAILGHQPVGEDHGVVAQASHLGRIVVEATQFGGECIDSCLRSGHLGPKCGALDSFLPGWGEVAIALVGDAFPQVVFTIAHGVPAGREVERPPERSPGEGSLFEFDPLAQPQCFEEWPIEGLVHDVEHLVVRLAPGEVDPHRSRISRTVSLCLCQRLR